GRVADALLQTRYPDRREAIEAELLATGSWDGTLEQKTQAGATLVLESRWVLQRDHHGRVTASWKRTATSPTARPPTRRWSAANGRYRRMFVGRVADALLQTRYPDRREAIEAELLATGSWDGT
ncbi:PAS domain-containing sensor histidine kinase, partial [Methylobacterium radiotolerans]